MIKDHRSLIDNYREDSRARPLHYDNPAARHNVNTQQCNSRPRSQTLPHGNLYEHHYTCWLLISYIAIVCRYVASILHK